MAENDTTQELTRFPVSLPGDGQLKTYEVSADMLVVFDFDVAEAIFSSNGNDLVITVEGKGTIVFEDYLLLAQNDNLPTFELLDGEQVTGDVYLFAFNEMEEDVETAASAGAGGAGAGAYVDDHGDLYHSLDVLQGQEDPGERTGQQPARFGAQEFRDTDSTAAANTAPKINGELNLDMNEDGTIVIRDTQILALVTDEPGSFVAVTSLTVSGGTLTQIAAGTWAFTPDQDFNGSLDVTFSVSDREFTVNGTGSIDVAAVNDAPVATDDTDAVTEDFTISGTLADHASDVDNEADELTYTIVGDAPTGFILTDANGSYTFDASSYDHLSEGDTEDVTLTYQVTDPDGASHTAELTITVSGSDDPIIITGDDRVTVSEDYVPTTVTGTLIATDADDADTPDFDIQDIRGDYGTLHINADGTWTYTPDERAQALSGSETEPTVDNFTVTARNNDSDTDALDHNIQITVQGQNDGPSLSFNEGTSVDVAENTAAGTVIATAAGTDPDAGDTLTYSVADDSPFAIDATTGEISIKDGSVFDFEGDSIPTSVEVTVTDADGLSTSQTLTINVTDVNEGPSLSFNEGTSVDVAENTAAGTVIATAAGTDPDAGDTLTYSVADDSPFAIDATTGEISIKDGSVFDFEGDSIPTSVEVTVTDADGLSTSQTLNINVTDVNEGPSLSFNEGTSVDVAENTAAGTIIATAAGTDPDAGDTLTYSVADDSPFAIDATTGEISIKDGSVFDFEGDSIPTSVEVTVTDADGLSTSQTLTINVTDVNEGPSLSFNEGTSVNVAENTAAGTVIATAAGTDPDAGDTLTYSVADDSPFAIDPATGEISIKDGSVFDFEGDSIPTSVEVTVEDADGLSTSQTLNINVTNVNEGPSLSFNEGTSVDVAENTAAGTVIATAAGTDPDAGDTLTYSVADDSPFAIDPATGEISIKDGSVFDFEGDSIPTSVEVTVEDADGLSTSQTLNINVTNVNEGPSLSFNEGTSVDVAENTAAGTVIATAAGTDPDAGDTLTYSVADDSPFAIDATTGEISIKDGSVFDFEGDSIPTSVEVTVTDADGLSTSQTLNINVTDVNEGPVAVDDVFGTTTVVDGETIDVTTPDSGVNVTTVINDWSGSGVNVSAHTGNGLDPDTWEDANIGTKNVSFNEGGQHYAYSGIAVSASGQIDGGETDTIDGSDTTDTEVMSISFDKPMETVTLELSALFDGLEESPNDGVDNRGPYDSGYVEMARVAIYDTDGVLLGTVDVSGTNNGLATITLDSADYGLPIGSVAVMPLDDGAGDSGSNSDFLLRSVSGETVDEVTGTYLEDQPIELTANDLLTHANAQGETDSDVDGDALSVTSVGNATHGTVSMDDDGNITFEPEDGFSGAATFEYTISDGHGGTDTAIVTLNITPVNDAPVIDLNDTGQHLDLNAADADSWSYNLVGMYVTDDAGNPVATEVLYHHTDVNGPEGFAIGELLTHVEDGQTPHFFFLNSGDARNSVQLTGEEGHTFSEDTSITFTQGADGQWYGTGIDETGNPLTFKAFFDDNSLNPDNHNRFTYSVADENGTRTLSIEEYNGHAIDRDDMRLTITPQEDDSSGYTTSFTEGGSAVSIVGNMTITDADSPDMSKAVITLTGAQAGDMLDTSGVSGLFVDTDITESGDIVVTLSGKATLAEYQNAIKAITFDNTSNDPVEGTRTVTVQVTDAAGNESDVSNSATTSITVTAVNEAPTSDAVTVNVDEDGSVTVTQAMLLANAQDADGDTMTATDLTVTGADGTTYALTDNGKGTWTFEPGDNIESDFSFNFNIDDGNGGVTPVNGTFDVQPVSDAPTSDAVTVTVTEDGSVTVTQAMLLATAQDADGDTMTAKNLTVTGADGTTYALTDNGNGTWTFDPGDNVESDFSFTFDIEDGTGESTPVNGTFDVQPVNDAPVIDGSGTTATYEEGDGALAILNGMSISDVDSDNLSTATITLSGTEAGDVLDTSGVSGLFVDTSTNASGDIVVTLSGTASVAEYESAIKSITFSNSSDDLDDGTRTVSVQVTDAEGTDSKPSTVATATIDVEGETDPGIWNFDVRGQEVTFHSEKAAYQNMLGIYTIVNGKPSDPEIILTNSNDKNMLKEVIHTFAEDAEVHFFFLPNVAGKTFDADGDLQFIADGDGYLLASGNDHLDAKFDMPEFNHAGEEYGFKFSGNAEAGFTAEHRETVTVSMDDQFVPGFKTPGDDDDFNDLVVKVQQTDDGLFEGGSGNDYAIGGKGDDTLIGGRGNDTLYGDDMFGRNHGDDQMDGGKGNDLMYGGRGDDQMDGGEGRDIMYGESGHDLINGGSGEDLIYGQSGNDTIDAGDNDDLVYAGSGNDLLNGGAGDDILYGQSGDNLLVGGAGDDTMYGGSDDDLFIAGDGADVIYTGSGNDTIFIDQSVLGEGHNTIEVRDFHVGKDVLEFGDNVVKEINVDDQNGMSLVVGNDENSNDDVVVKLLGVTPTQLENHGSIHDTDTTANDLIQHMIDSAHNGHNN